MRLAVGIALVLALLAAQGSARAQPDDSAGVAQSLAALIAFEHVAKREMSIYVMDPDGSGQRALAPGCCAAWSPDGTMLALVRRVGRGVGDLFVINRDGTGLRELVSGLAHVPAGFVPWLPPDAPTWSPDSRQIAFSGSYKRAGTAIYVVNVDGSGLARLTSPRPQIEDVAPAWSPDGTQIVFERDNYADSGRGFPLVIMNADGTNQRVLTTKTMDAITPAWSRDSTRITFAGGQDLDHLDIFVMDRDGSGQTNLTKTKSPDDSRPQFSPDGRLLVFESFTGGPGNREINVINVSGTKHRNLSRSPFADYNPAWTADGRIMFVSTRDGNGDIHVTTPSGTGVTNLTNTPIELGYSRRATWSPTP